MRSLALLFLVACNAPAPELDAVATSGAAPSFSSSPRIVAEAGADPDRLIATYLAYLQAHPGAQSNGLDGAHVADVCTLWSQLQPSARAVFLTITSRLAGSHLPDGTSMLAHVARLYRVVG